MTDRIEASKLPRQLGAVLERVVAGETIEVVRYGRVVAVLAPPSGAVQPDTARPVQPEVVKGANPAAARQQRVDEILGGVRRKKHG